MWINRIPIADDCNRIFPRFGQCCRSGFVIYCMDFPDCHLSQFLGLQDFLSSSDYWCNVLLAHVQYYLLQNSLLSSCSLKTRLNISGTLPSRDIHASEPWRDLGLLAYLSGSSLDCWWQPSCFWRLTTPNTGLGLGSTARMGECRPSLMMASFSWVPEELILQGE